MLVALTPEFKELTFEWRNDPDIYKWCRQIGPLNWMHHEKWWNGLADRDDIRMFGIQKFPASVGVCGFTDIDYINSRAEFSLYIASSFKRQGFATLAIKELFTFGFKNLGLNSIWGETFDGNPAINLFESIGMVKEGTRREFYYRDGKFIDAHLYSIKASEWKY